MFRPSFSPRAVLATVAGASLAAAAGSTACRDVTAPEQDPATATYAAALGIRLADFTHDTSGIYYQDVPVGPGTLAVTNSTVSVDYIGYLTDGRVFDSNVNATAPATYVVGDARLVRGFNRALLGIRAGGRRRVIIPPALGYGNTSVRTSIPANSILIYQLDARAVTAPATTTTPDRAPAARTP